MNNKKNIELDALYMFRDLLKKGPRPLKEKDFYPGSMLAYMYHAKDKTKPWDRNPLIFVLRRSKGYTLGLNFHWVPKKIRYVLLEYVFKKNTKNIKAGLPLTLSYKEIKELVINLRLSAVIRLYINKRISTKGIKIPNEHMRKAIHLPSENFIGITADQAYGLMVKKRTKKAKPKTNIKAPVKNRKQRNIEKAKK